MTVRARADDVEGVVRRDEHVAPHGAANELNGGGREPRQIAQRFVFDLAAAARESDGFLNGVSRGVALLPRRSDSDVKDCRCPECHKALSEAEREAWAPE